MNHINRLLLMFAVCLPLVACQSYEEPEFRYITGLRLADLSTEEIRLEADAIFFNPNKMGVRVTEVDIQAVVNGIPVSDVRQVEAVSVKGMTDFSVPLTISFPTKQLFSNFLSALQFAAQNKKIDVQYTGFVRVRVVGVGFKVPVDYKGQMDFNWRK